MIRLGARRGVVGGCFLSPLLDGEMDVAACKRISEAGRCDDDESWRRRDAAAVAAAKEGATFMRSSELEREGGGKFEGSITKFESLV